MISPSTLIPQLLADHPGTRSVFNRYGLHGCGGASGPVESVAFFARAHGVEQETLLREIEAAVESPIASADTEERLEDSLYRRYFAGGIIAILTAGATWGAWLLWKIAFSGKFTGVSIHEVNAHGHAQIFGWVGLFIMGFGYQAFPRIWHTRLWRPGLAVVAFVMMLVGLVLRTVGMTAAGQPWALPLAMIGGYLEIGSVAIFAEQLLVTFWLSKAKVEPYVGFVIAALAFLLIQAVVCVWHTWRTMIAATREDLLWQVATWQAPLRDLQIHGLALLMILGVSIRMLPAFFDLPRISNRRAWCALGILTFATIAEVAVFVAYRATGKHSIAALLMIPWVMLAVGIWMIAGKWKLWRGLKPIEAHADRTAKFILAAYSWLGISMVMLLLLPLHQVISGIPFSHAYYGAIRHAITVGFISMMIMGFAAKVVPTLNGVDPTRLSALWGPFVLINIGCFLRCFLQTMTDVHPAFFKFVGISGVLEVSALAWWGVGLIGIMRRGKREARQAKLAAPPTAISADTIVADIIQWFPGAVDVLAASGFAEIRNRLLQRTMAKTVTIAQAARMKGIELAPLLEALNSATRGCATTNEQPRLVQLGLRK